MMKWRLKEEKITKWFIWKLRKGFDFFIKHSPEYESLWSLEVCTSKGMAWGGLFYLYLY